MCNTVKKIIFVSFQYNIANNIAPIVLFISSKEEEGKNKGTRNMVLFFRVVERNNFVSSYECLIA